MQLLESHSLLLENINTNLFDTSPEEAEGIVEFGNNLAICNHNRQRTNSAPWDNSPCVQPHHSSKKRSRYRSVFALILQLIARFTIYVPYLALF